MSLERLRSTVLVVAVACATDVACARMQPEWLAAHPELGRVGEWEMLVRGLLADMNVAESDEDQWAVDWRQVDEPEVHEAGLAACRSAQQHLRWGLVGWNFGKGRAWGEASA